MTILGFVSGVLAGCLVTNIFYHTIYTFGTLKIDNSDTEKDIYRLDIKDLDSLSKKKIVVLKVEPGVKLSQK